MKMGFGTYWTEPLATAQLAQAVLLAAARTDGRGTDANDLKGSLAQARTFAEQLKKKNLFVRTGPPQHPVSEVLGILGDEALINDKWYKVGDSVGDAKIVAIEPTKVKVAWNGQEKEFSPIGAGGSGGPAGARSARAERTAPGNRPSRAGGAQVVISGQRRGPGRGGLSSLSPEERQRMREQWQNMSPEERQRRREEMRQRFGGRSQ
jgi:hypothetical protein